MIRLTTVARVAQVWNLTNCKLRASLVGHTGYINTVTVSPDGSLCASGGKARRPRPAPVHVTRVVHVNRVLRWRWCAGQELDYEPML